MLDVGDKSASPIVAGEQALSMPSGLFQKRRGVRSGLPDALVLFRYANGIIVIFRRAEIAARSREQSAETNPHRDAASRCAVPERALR